MHDFLSLMHDSLSPATDPALRIPRRHFIFSPALLLPMLLLLLLVLLGLSLHDGQSIAAGEAGSVYNVDPNGQNQGDNFTKISWALENATGGEKIVIQTGNYTEHLDLNIPVTLEAAPGATVNLTSPSDKFTPLFINASHVNVSGLEISRSYYGMLVNDSMEFSIDNCTIHSNEWGIYIAHGIDGSVRDCNISGNSWQVYLLYSTGINMTGNAISDIEERNAYNIAVSGSERRHYDHDIHTSNTVEGRPVHYYYGRDDLVLRNITAGHVSVYYSDVVDLENITVQDGDGFFIRSSNHTVVSNCTAINNPSGMYITRCDNISISGTILTDNIVGINAQVSQGVSVSGTDIAITRMELRYYNSLGIGLYNVSGATVTDCYVDNIMYGIWSDLSANVTITGCELSRCYRAVEVVYSKTPFEIANNSFSNNTNHLILADPDWHELENNRAVTYIRIDLINSTGEPIRNVQYNLEYMGKYVYASPGYGGGDDPLSAEDGRTYLYLEIVLDNDFYENKDLRDTAILSLKKGEWEIVREISSYSAPLYPYHFNIGPPDLNIRTMTGITFSRNQPLAGEIIVITASFQNEGNSDVRDATVAFYYRKDGSQQMELIGTDTLSANATLALNYKASVQWTTREGKFDIIVILDPDGAVNESDENNNRAERTLTASSGDSGDNNKREEGLIILLIAFAIVMIILFVARMKSNQYLKKRAGGMEKDEKVRSGTEEKNEPDLQIPEANFQTPEPDLQTPEANPQTPEPDLQIPEANFQAPEPNPDD